MVWRKGATLGGSDGAGHVAIVEKIMSPTQIVTSESGYGAKAFYTKTRNKGSGNWGAGTGYTFLGFIYNPAPCCQDTGPTEAAAPGTAANGYTLQQFIRDVQKATGAAVDGVAGPETIRKTVTLSAKKNAAHAAVLAVQKRLAALGYAEVGKADGVAGPKFTSAVAHFQQDNGCHVDGEITAKNKTWRKLLGMR
jgi:peptidoglycan hydrolase-like protein with peptidoglycan-binding domain